MHYFRSIDLTLKTRIPGMMHGRLLGETDGIVGELVYQPEGLMSARELNGGYTAFLRLPDDVPAPDRGEQ